MSVPYFTSTFFAKSFLIHYGRMDAQTKSCLLTPSGRLCFASASNLALRDCRTSDPLVRSQVLPSGSGRSVTSSQRSFLPELQRSGLALTCQPSLTQLSYGRYVCALFYLNVLCENLPYSLRKDGCAMFRTFDNYLALYLITIDVFSRGALMPFPQKGVDYQDRGV